MDGPLPQDGNPLVDSCATALASLSIAAALSVSRQVAGVVGGLAVLSW